MDVPRPAVFRAIEGHDIEGLRRLVADDPAAAGARDPAGLTALRAARYRGATDLVAILLAAGPPMDAFDAATVGDLARLQALLAANPDLVSARSNDGWTALHLAVFFDQPAAARLLVEAGSDLPGERRPTLRPEMRQPRFAQLSDEPAGANPRVPSRSSTSVFASGGSPSGRQAPPRWGNSHPVSRSAGSS